MGIDVKNLLDSGYSPADFVDKAKMDAEILARISGDQALEDETIRIEGKVDSITEGLSAEIEDAQRAANVYSEQLAIEKVQVAQWYGQPTLFRPNGEGLSGLPALRHIINNYDVDKLGTILFLSISSYKHLNDAGPETKFVEDLRFPTLQNLNDYLAGVRDLFGNPDAFTFTFYRKQLKSLRQGIVPYNLMYSMLVGRRRLATKTTKLYLPIEEGSISGTAMRRLITDLYSTIHSYAVPGSEMVDAARTITKRAAIKKMFNLYSNNSRYQYIHDDVEHSDRCWFDTVSEQFVGWPRGLSITYGESWYWTFPLGTLLSELLPANSMNSAIFFGSESFLKVKQLQTIIDGHLCVAYRVQPVGYDTIVINHFFDRVSNGNYNIYMGYKDSFSAEQFRLIADDLLPSEPPNRFYRILPLQWKSKLPSTVVRNNRSQKTIKFFVADVETGISFPALATLGVDFRVKGALFKPMLK